MGKFFRRFIFILLGAIVVVLVGAATLASVFENQIGRKLVTEINKNITSELSVEDFDISVLTTFPNAAANLRNVVLQDALGGILLEAEKVSFRFRLLSLLSSSIKVKSVVVENGALVIKIDKTGRPNYDIFIVEEQPDAAPESEGDGLAISLEEARLNNIELIYTDETTQQTVLSQVENATFSGEFSSSQFSLTSKAALLTEFVEYDGNRFLQGKELSYKAQVFVNMDEGLYEMQGVTLAIGGTEFRADGRIQQGKNYTDFDLTVQNEGGNLESVLQLLPQEYLDYVSDFSSQGTFYFKALVDGRMDERQSPAINVEFGLNNGRISSAKLNNPFKDVQLKATFTNGAYRSNRSSVFEIENLKGYFERQLIELRLRLENLDDPSLNFSLDGALPLASVYGLFNSPSITKGGGEIEIKDFRLNGRLEDMQNPSRIGRVEAKGELIFDDASLTINGEKMLIDRGDLVLNNNTLSVQDIKIEGAGSDILLQGTFYNLIPVLFADSLNTNRAELIFESKLQSEKMDIGRLVALSATPVKEGEVSQATYDSLKVEEVQEREQFTQFLKGTFDATVKAFNYNKIKGKDFIGKLQFDNNQMTINGKTAAMKGAFDLNGTMYFEERPYLKTKLICTNIDAHDFFAETENFGQEVLRSDHVSGRLNANIAIYAYWDEQMNFLMDELRVLAGVAIENGELKGFEMLESFSTFVKIKDLRHINFQGLQNYLEIRNSRLYLPVMFIQSNALNMTVNGEYSFDSDIDFNIKINAGQVLANRFKQYNPNMDPQPAQRNGWFNLYYKIYGTVEDYKYETAKREVKKDFERSEIRKREIQSALEREFNNVALLKEPPAWKDIPEYGDPNDEDVEYLDGFN